MQHPDEGTIHAWLDDQLSPEERARLEQHFDQCEQCAALVVEARGLVAGAARIVGALDGVRSGVIPATKRAGSASPKSLWRALRFTPVRAAIAATLLLATATVFTVRQGGQMADSARPAGAMPASAAAPTLPMAAGAAPPPAPVAAMAAPPAASVGRRAATESRAKPDDRAVVPNAAAIASEKPRANTLSQTDAAAHDSNSSGITAANARPAMHADSIVMRESKAMPAALPQSPPQRRMFAGAVSQIVATGLEQTTDPRAFGCYRLNVDSLRDRFTSLRQFGLSSPNGVNVVNALGSSGRPDSVIAGAVWRPLDRDSVAVSTPRSSPPATLVFALGEEGRNATGRLTANGQTTRVEVLRTRCP